MGCHLVLSRFKRRWHTVPIGKEGEGYYTKSKRILGNGLNRKYGYKDGRQ